MTPPKKITASRRACFALASVSALCLTLFATLSHAQTSPPNARPTAAANTVSYASLIADDLRLIGQAGLVAAGNVEIFHNGVRLRAESLQYDKRTEALSLVGPLRLTEGENITILADTAQLSTDLRNGVLRSARIVLEQQLQLAANEIGLVNGRYIRMNDTVVTSCQTCAQNPVPLWEIRARSVVHDRNEKQLYFTNASFRIKGVPVLWLPRLRLPDPTLERATGFLLPRFRSSSRLGSGLQMPYFIRIGDHKDLTLTPWISSRTRTLEARYRQAFRNGDITIDSAWSDDDLQTSKRWYVFAEGKFELPRDYQLAFNIETTSDRAYLLDYGFSDKDRLESNISVTRARRDKFVRAELIHFNSLRAGEINSTLPTIVSNFLIHRRTEPSWIPGALDWQVEGHTHYRSSDIRGISGRDVARLSARVDWRNSHTLQNGMVFATMAGADLDYYAFGDAAAGEEDGLYGTGTIGAELRWPLIRQETTTGATHLLEPVVQVFYSHSNRSGLPNEDSVLLEFDEGNLWSDSRFSGSDRVETGLRSNIGFNWTRQAPSGWSLSLAAGRIYRDQSNAAFTSGSGLSGTSSDWLLAAQVQLKNGLTLSNRALFDDHLDFSRNETRVNWSNDRISLGSSYLWIEAAPAENRPQASEWAFDGKYDFNDQWSGSANWRYDFINDRAAKIGLGLEYRNECTNVSFTASRRFTSNAATKPATDYGISVSLAGFGANTGRRALARRCSP
ncbi:LPS-assembly protein LptD [Halocynthiibacter namhaensis]|uniref:LPS-assembly protein LptD n=1 Tax=Halocynthiibacter namhaensis TaxID=1290553 RepID=UPI00068D127E|nr:LPS assembly protein LptD [Halocynthiibacter namhaensis]